MTIFVDASAMIAMMAGERDADELADRLGAERMRLCSAVSIWETVAGLCRTYTFSVPSARAAVRSFIELNNVRYVSIGEQEFDLAAQACAEFGKGRHAASLNMGDCFAYACAKVNRAALLFKGTDFSKTDIRIA
ncbi:MAG TPA: type II toxin-antitoxin system VapC family toxin [Acetobacteraceae bacterium]